MAGYWEDERRPPQAIRDGWFHTGDLGRFDEKGNLYLVGPIEGRDRRLQRQERLSRRDRGSVPRLAVHQGAVGRRSARRRGEQVACAIAGLRPRRDAGARRRRARVRSTSARCRRSCRSGSGSRSCTSGTASCRDRQALGEAPGHRRRARTAAPQRESEGALAAVAPATSAAVGWLLDLVATVSGEPRGDVHLQSRLDELGFDSLMYTELASALENEGIALPEDADFTAVVDVAELHDLAARAGAGARAWRGGAAATRARRAQRRRHPRPVGGRHARASAAWRLAQRLFYKRVLDTAGPGRQPRPAPHPLHRRGQPLPRTWTWGHQGGAGRVGPRPHVAGGGRLLLPQQVPARVFQALHQPGAHGAHRARSASRWTRPRRCCAAGAAWWCSPRGRAR